MSKVSNIRKKALELVRKQEWPAAIKEYKRLAELDQSNPNVFNELGDIYLKINNKNDAYESFEKAIDAYTRVSLHNNAVAVAKKVLRVLPARYEVLARLGHIRHRQGLTHEAESYYASFLKNLTAERGAAPADVAKNCMEIATNVPDSTAMLEAVLECLDQHKLEEDAGTVMVKLHPLYVKQGNQAGADRLKSKLADLGMADMVEPTQSSAPEGTVITEDNLWSESHSDGERVPVETSDDGAGKGEAVQMGSAESGPNVFEYGQVEIPANAATAAGEEASSGEGDASASHAAHFESTPLDEPAAPAGAAQSTETSDSAVATAEAEPEEPPVDSEPPASGVADAAEAEEPDDTPVAPAEYVIDDTSDDESGDETPDAGPGPEVPTVADSADATPAAPPTASPAPARTGRTSDDPADAVHVSAVMDAPQAPGEMTGEDFRSHYDLGMAYLEMELHADAIREFQLAARSPEFQLKCLEMIGQCFIAEGQPQLAIKQLTRGLHLITGDDRVALGIRYNLGVAYQMVGDAEAARSQFEDVYVVDVTFRDVDDRLKALQ